MNNSDVLTNKTKSIKEGQGIVSPCNSKYEFSGPKNSKNRPSKIREKSKKIEKTPNF
jgi:hypothetical protein